MKKLKFSIFLFIAVLVFTPFVSADLTTSLEVYYSFDDDNLTGSNPDDLSGNGNDGTTSGATTGTTGILGEAFDFDGSNDYVTVGDIVEGSSAFTINAWVYADTTTGANPIYQDWRAAGERSVIARINDGDIFFITHDGSGQTGGATQSFTDTSGWNMITYVYDGSQMRTYVNTVVGGTTYVESATIDTTTGSERIGGDTYNSQYFDGQIDELGVWSKALNSTEISNLYNSGSGLSYYYFSTGLPPEPSTPTASERYEQLAEIEQDSDATVTSTSYTTITSNTINISDAAKVYAVGTINLNPSKDNTAYCRLTLDGVEYNDSERSRSVTAGSNGNLIFSTGTEDLSAGSYDVNLECRKGSGNPTYTIDVFNSTVYFHILTSADGDELEYTNIHLTDEPSSTTETILGSTTITLSENYTEAGTNRYLVVDYAGQLDYDAAASNFNTILITPTINGTDCVGVQRSKESGTTGTIGGSCYLGVGNETNGTKINISVYGRVINGGTEAVNFTNAYFHIKEFIMNSDEIASDSYDNAGSPDNLSTQEEYFSVDINTSQHGNANIFSNAFISAASSGTTAEGSFYLTNTSKNSATISRTFNPNQLGVIFVQEEFSGTTAVDTINLNASCSPFCLVPHGSLTAYLVDTVAATPNSFEITANSIYGGTISAFAVNLSDGRIFSTTSGTINVPASDGSVFNVTAQENSEAAIPYFANYTLNFNTNGDLALNLTPYTVINVSGNTTISNFTVNGTSTTNGKVYLRLYDDTYNLSLTDATDDNGADYANTNASVTASPYLEYYTFVPKYSNTINISFYDEETGALLNNTTVYFEAISESQAGNYTTSTGTLTESFLLPDTYTFRFNALGYEESFYSLTINERSFNALNLTLLNSTSATEVTLTVYDTLGNTLEDATIKVLKYDVATNTYFVTEILNTNFEGVTTANIVLNSEYYKFIIEYDGETRLTTSPTYIYGTTLTFYVPTSSSGMADLFDQVAISGTIYYNYGTNIATFTYSDTENTATQGCLYAYTRNLGTNTLVNTTCVSSSSGSLNLPAFNSSETWVFEGKVTKGGETYLISTYRTDFDQRLNETGSGAFFAFLVLATVVFIGLFSLEIAVVLAAAVPLLFTVTKLAEFDYIISIPILLLGLVVAFIIGSNKK